MPESTQELVARVHKNVELLEEMVSGERRSPFFDSDVYVDSLPWRSSSNPKRYFQPEKLEKGKACIPFSFTYATHSGLIMPPRFDERAGVYTRAYAAYVIDVTAHQEACSDVLKNKNKRNFLAIPGFLTLSDKERLVCYQRADRDSYEHMLPNFDISRIPKSPLPFERSTGDHIIRASLDIFNVRRNAIYSHNSSTS